MVKVSQKSASAQLLKRINALIETAVADCRECGIDVDSVEVVELAEQYAVVRVLSEEGEQVGQGDGEAVVHHSSDNQTILTRIIDEIKSASGYNERSFRAVVARAVRTCNESDPSRTVNNLETAGRIIHGVFMAA